MLEAPVIAVLNILKRRGHGWAKYAESVEAQGWASDKQRQTLARMVLESAPKRGKGWKGEGTGGVGCLEHEWQSFGDYY